MENVIRSERGGAMTLLSIIIWFGRACEALGLQGARRILADGLSSRRLHATSIRPVARCGTCSFSLVIALSKQHNAISTATPTLNGG
jgi:hypothetical protein